MTKEVILTFAEQCMPGIDEFYTPDVIKKFAELLIKECIKCGNNLANHYINKHSEQEHTFLLASISDYSNEIKKHFGVIHD